jgi:hypothetical protein
MATSHPTGIFPLCFAAVTRSDRAAVRAEVLGWLLVSRSPLVAMLLAIELTLAVENHRAASHSDGVNARQAAMTIDPIIAADFDEKKHCVCMTRTPRSAVVRRPFLLLRKFR